MKGERREKEIKTERKERPKESKAICLHRKENESGRIGETDREKDERTRKKNIVLLKHAFFFLNKLIS